QYAAGVWRNDYARFGSVMAGTTEFRRSTIAAPGTAPANESHGDARPIFTILKRRVWLGLCRRLAHAVIERAGEGARSRLFEPDGCRATGSAGRVPRPPRQAGL